MYFQNTGANILIKGENFSSKMYKKAKVYSSINKQFRFNQLLLHQPEVTKNTNL
jgi:hypothetical protein